MQGPTAASHLGIRLTLPLLCLLPSCLPAQERASKSDQGRQPTSQPRAGRPGAQTTIQHPNLHSVLWTQRSAEHQALCLGVFRNARRCLDRAIGDRHWTALPGQAKDQAVRGKVAVVVDVDETILDNSPFQAQLIRDGHSFSRELWSNWVNQASARPLPGALAFANHAKAKGVTLFFVTNRSKDLEAATRRNLRQAGFHLADEAQPGHPDVVLTLGEITAEPHGEKNLRRAQVALTHRIALLLGDDLGDFLAKVKPKRNPASTPTSARLAAGKQLLLLRQRRVSQHANRWGRQWFMMPNPMYGSWERTLRRVTQGKGKPDALRLK